MPDYIEQYQSLAAAVVKQAATDYRSALKRIHRHPRDTEAGRIINDCERFFMNEIEIYCDLDGRTVMRQIKEMAGEELKNEQRQIKTVQDK